MTANRSARPTFAQWMSQFAMDTTPRGDLARYMAKTIPLASNPKLAASRTLALWERHFRTFGADKALFDELADASMAFACIYPHPHWKPVDEFRRCYRRLYDYKQDPSIPGDCLFGHAENCSRVSKELGCSCSWTQCPHGGEWEPKETPIAYCRAVKGLYEYDLVIDCCPLCGGTHEHGGGSLKGNPGDWLGHRSSHCHYGGDVMSGYVLKFQEDGNV